MKLLPWLAAAVGGGIGVYLVIDRGILDNADQTMVAGVIPDTFPIGSIVRGGAIVGIALVAGKTVHMLTGGKVPQGVKV